MIDFWFSLSNDVHSIIIVVSVILFLVLLVLLPPWYFIRKGYGDNSLESQKPKDQSQQKTQSQSAISMRTGGIIE